MATRDYESGEITVHWDSSRCIHTGLCLRALPSVFDVGRRPWVEIDAASADEVAAAVELCPTGALRYSRGDGPGESSPEPPRVVPSANGPLIVHGRVRVEGPDGEQLGEETRLALCRCGKSANQPFCDNSHRAAGFRSSGERPEVKLKDPPEPIPDDEPTTVILRRDGSLRFRGPIRVESVRGELICESNWTSLCRCGQSSNKPFCDSSHRDSEFCSREPEVAAERESAESPASQPANADLGLG